MLNSRNFQIIGATVLIIAATLVMLSAVKAPAAALVDLSWPPRPDFSILNQKGIIPFTGDQAASDYYERHSNLNGRTVTAADMSDYSLRHPGMKLGFSAAADLSDYALRHSDLSKSSGAADSSDYFLRHR